VLNVEGIEGAIGSGQLKNGQHNDQEKRTKQNDKPLSTKYYTGNQRLSNTIPTTIQGDSCYSC